MGAPPFVGNAQACIASIPVPSDEDAPKSTVQPRRVNAAPTVAPSTGSSTCAVALLNRGPGAGDMGAAKRSSVAPVEVREAMTNCPPRVDRIIGRAPIVALADNAKADDAGWPALSSILPSIALLLVLVISRTQRQIAS